MVHGVCERHQCGCEVRGPRCETIAMAAGQQDIGVMGSWSGLKGKKASSHKMRRLRCEERSKRAPHRTRRWSCVFLQSQPARPHQEGAPHGRFQRQTCRDLPLPLEVWPSPLCSASSCTNFRSSCDASTESVTTKEMPCGAMRQG